MNRSFSFFHQVGWVMIAIAVGGVCNTLVHTFARKMPEDEYGLFGVSLQSALPLLALPATGLQVVFAQMAAGATTDESRRNLGSTLRGVCGLLAAIWLLAALFVLLFRKSILQTYEIQDPAVLVVVMSIALLTLVLPVLVGVLQGRQEFLWFGWVQMLAGAGRVVGVAGFLFLLGGDAIWALCGVLIGVAAASVVAFWKTRDVWRTRPGTFDWRGLLTKAGPLTLAVGSLTYLNLLDAAIAREAFGKDASGAYTAAGTVGRALIFLTGAVTTVMFPRIVNEAATSTKSSVLAQALGLTLGVGALTALVCSIMPELPLRIIYGDKYLSAAPLVPWFAWCLLPLTLAATLVNNLLARGRYGITVPMILIAAGYWSWLQYRFSKEQMEHAPASFEVLIQSMGAAALAACLAAAAMTWWARKPRSLPTYR